MTMISIRVQQLRTIKGATTRLAVVAGKDSILSNPCLSRASARNMISTRCRSSTISTRVASPGPPNKQRAVITTQTTVAKTPTKRVRPNPAGTNKSPNLMTTTRSPSHLPATKTLTTSKPEATRKCPHGRGGTIDHLTNCRRGDRLSQTRKRMIVIERREQEVEGGESRLGKMGEGKTEKT